MLIGFINWNILSWDGNNGLFNSLHEQGAISYPEVPSGVSYTFNALEFQANVDEWWMVLTVLKVIENNARCWLWVAVD